VGTGAEQYLHMEDMEVDDAKWNISAWFFWDRAQYFPELFDGYSSLSHNFITNSPNALFLEQQHYSW
jgi:hypothetical protein